MKFGPSSIALILALTILTTLPSSYLGMNRAAATNQSLSPTTWLPFGPQSDQLILQYYSDYHTMFNAFTTGGPNGIDITDWPMFPADIATLCNGAINPDYFCGSAQDQLGIFDLQINHHKPLLGAAQLAPRTTSAVSVSLTVGPAGCSAGFGSVTVQLQNQEVANAGITDPNNSMTLTQVLSGGVLGTSTTVAGPGPSYAFPCVIAGNYLLSNSAYANCPSSGLVPCEIALGSGTTNTAVFHSNYNSPSTFNLAQPG